MSSHQGREERFKEKFGETRRVILQQEFGQKYIQVDELLAFIDSEVAHALEEEREIVLEKVLKFIWEHRTADSSDGEEIFARFRKSQFLSLLHPQANPTDYHE